MATRLISLQGCVCHQEVVSSQNSQLELTYQLSVATAQTRILGAKRESVRHLQGYT